MSDDQQQKYCKQCGCLMSEFPQGDCTTPHVLDKPDASPREFWVKEHRSGRNISNKLDLFTAVQELPQNPGWIHVIEKSAYLELSASMCRVLDESHALKQRVAELEKFKSEYRFRDTHEYTEELEKDLTETCEELAAAKVSLGKEQDDYQKLLAKLLEARSEIERLSNIEIANKEWTRNDAVTFGKLYLKLANAEAEIEEINQEGAELHITLAKQLTQANARIKAMEREQKLVAENAHLRNGYWEHSGVQQKRDNWDMAEKLKEHKGGGFYCNACAQNPCTLKCAEPCEHGIAKREYCDECQNKGGV